MYVKEFECRLVCLVEAFLSFFSIKDLIRLNFS